MNEYFFRLINSWSGQNPWLDHLMIFSAEWLGYFLVLLLAIPWLVTFFIVNNRFSSWARFILLKFGFYKEMLIVSFVSAFVSRFVFVEIIRFFYDNPRPFMVLSDINQLINHEATPSLPSGHATFYTALAAGVYLYNKKAGYIYLTSALLISFSRIFTGVHWPLDVVAGAIIGGGTAVGLKMVKNTALLIRIKNDKILG